MPGALCFKGTISQPVLHCVGGGGEGEGPGVGAVHAIPWHMYGCTEPMHEAWHAARVVGAGVEAKNSCGMWGQQWEQDLARTLKIL